jgi:hypothetical protein
MKSIAHLRQKSNSMAPLRHKILSLFTFYSTTRIRYAGSSKKLVCAATKFDKSLDFLLQILYNRL